MLLGSILMLLAPTFSVIDCAASVLISPDDTLIVWLPVLIVSVSLPVSISTTRLPVFTVWVSLPVVTSTSRLPFLMVTVSSPVLTVSVRFL